MPTHFPCKRCGAPVSPGAQAQLLASCAAAVALDCACARCGHRALYHAGRPSPVAPRL